MKDLTTRLDDAKKHTVPAKRVALLSDFVPILIEIGYKTDTRRRYFALLKGWWGWLIALITMLVALKDQVLLLLKVSS